MDFTELPYPPLSFDFSPEEAQATLRGSRYIYGSFSDKVAGYLYSENQSRQVIIHFNNGRTESIELAEIKQGDTFLSVPLKCKVLSFLTELDKKGIKYVVEEDGVDLTHLPVSFYVERGKIASVCWERQSGKQ